MIVCITSRGPTLDSLVDQTFGRARYFLFVETETRTFEAIENAPPGHGAGVQAAQLVANRDARVLITGNIGPNAHQGLSAAEVRTLSSTSGTVAEALANLEMGKLIEIGAPTRSGHGEGRERR